MGENSTKQQEWRGIIKEIVSYSSCRGALFGSVVLSSVVCKLGHPGVGQASGRVEADKISTGGFRERDDQAVSSRGHEQEDSDLDGEQYCAVKVDALPVQPSA